MCYRGFSKKDFIVMIQQTTINLDIKSTTAEYLNHKGQHDRFIINLTANESHFDE